MDYRKALALAILSHQAGDTDKCLEYLSKAGEFGDDLTQYVYTELHPSPGARATGDNLSPSDNTIAPSLFSMASSDSTLMAMAKFVDEDDQIIEAPVKGLI
jgi:hypothetical protein